MQVRMLGCLVLLSGALSVTTAARAEGLRYEDVHAGDVEAVTRALAAGAGVDAPVVSGRERESRPPLLVAARAGRLELVRLLVSRGASVERRQEEGRGESAFEGAFKAGQLEVASFLLEAPPAPSQEYLAHVLRSAISHRMKGGSEAEPSDAAGLALARRALARGLRPDAREVRWTFHELTVREDLRALVLLLEEALVDPNLPAETFEGRLGPIEYGPPLVDAAEHCQIETVRRLLDRGARTDVQGAHGATALHVAARHGREDVTKLLLDRGASPAILDAEGHRAAWMARRRHMTGVLELFAAAGAAVTPTEEAEVVALEAAEARREAEGQARSQERARQQARRDRAITAGAFAAWAVYLGVSIAAQRSAGGAALGDAGRALNLWAGPVLAGVGVGALAGIGLSMALSTSSGGIPAMVDPWRPGVVVGVATLLALGALNAAHRSDLASHPWLYHAGPVLSGGIPIALTLLRW